VKLKAWQYEALNFPYADKDLVERLYIEFFAASGRNARVDAGKKRRPYGKRPPNPLLMERDKEFIAAYKSGKTLEEIGRLYGITRERVRQRLSAHGLDRESGGSTIKQFKKIPDRVAKRQAAIDRKERRHFETWGCSREFIDSLSPLPRSHRLHPLTKYVRQMKSAQHNSKVGWRFTFATWWKVWQESGHWNERGRGKDKYVMARFGDTGPYSPENVEIITHSQNSQDSFISHPGRERAAKAKITRARKSVAQ